MPSIPEQKNRRLFLIWEHYDVMKKAFSRLFLKKCLKTIRFHTDYCPGKGVPIGRANWNWYISCIDKRWKINLKINLLDEWAVYFLKGKPPEIVRFFNEINIFAILCQLHEKTKITNSIQYHKSNRKFKSENGRTRTSEYIRGGIRCHGGVSIPCRSITPAVSPFSD
jgi:hypothetical protein